MPNYEYRCENCGEVFTRSEHMSEHGSSRPQCPKCKSDHTQPQMSPFYAKTARKS